MYRTINELNNFQFEEAYIDDMSFSGGCFTAQLENVKILPENSCNRDIRVMRTNDLKFTIKSAELTEIIIEGYKRFDADGKLIENVDDENVDLEKNPGLLSELSGATIYSIEKNDDNYVICVETEEQIFDIKIKGEDNVQEWERFLNV